MIIERHVGRPASRQLGDRLKERGQQLALEFAGVNWPDLALERLRKYIAADSERRFAIEDFRAWAIADGLPEPASHYAWGGLPRLAIRAGLMNWTGQYVSAKSPKTHAHPVKLWRAA